ncbi:MAG: serine/threonine protein kinase [Myxococcales bacterium]|nr:serine/threonine protein kinase [Myxococcales bacterium]
MTTGGEGARGGLGVADSYGATLAQGAQSGVAAPRTSLVATESGTQSLSRGAVLPKTVATAEGPQLVHESRLRYEAVKRLGEGAFGAVELVRDNDIGRMVAIKRLKTDWQDADSLARFAGEVQVIGQLEHPGIVPVHDVGLDENGYFFVMKFVEGLTLETVIERLSAKDPDAVARFTHEARAQLFLQLCKAVQYAHNKGLIHRDIKPANVMIGPYGEVMLMDFGLAKQIGTHDAKLAPGQSNVSAYGTMLGHAIGTPMYMPPEQARGEHDRCDARSDVYALGALFFHLMALHSYLGDRRDVNEILEAVKNAPPPGALAMHQLHGIPPEYAWIVWQCLQKDPEARLQSVAALANRVQAALEGRGEVLCPCTGLKRAGGAWSRFIDRHGVASLVLAAAVSAVFVVGLVSVVRGVVALASG